MSAENLKDAGINTVTRDAGQETEEHMVHVLNLRLKVFELTGVVNLSRP